MSARGNPEPDLILSATLIKVIDGDTLKVRLDSGPITIRLHGIDTPERKQPFGGAATKVLRSLVEGQPLEIEPIEQTDGYGRMVAKVFVHGDDINARLVESGYAWAYRARQRGQDVPDISYAGETAERCIVAIGRKASIDSAPAGWRAPN